MTREEQYLAKIAGEETDIPNKPILRSEQYLAKIAGENVEIPEKPLLNEEIYLAILTGESYDIPAPYNRIEQYMAKACGLEIEAPSPITRVEHLWAKISEGGSWTVTEITGTLPLTFFSKGDDLIDYRIHGTTEGAGVETENVYDLKLWEQAHPTYCQTVGDTVYITGVDASMISGAINVDVPSGYYFIVTPMAAQNGTTARQGKLRLIDENGTAHIYYITNVNNAPLPQISEQLSFAVKKIGVDYNAMNNGFGVKQMMFTPTAPTTYIPFGYKIPILNTSGVTENLFDKDAETTNVGDVKKYIIAGLVPGAEYTASTNFVRTGDIASIYYNNGTSVSGFVDSEHPRTSVADSNGQVWIGIRYKSDGTAPDIYDKVLNGEIWVMITKGSTPPDHYIPHRYTSDIPIYIGDSKLGAEEYLDYGEQKVYKRTENLHNVQTDLLDYRITWATGALIQSQGSSISDYIPVIEGQTYSVNRILIWLGYDSQQTYLGAWYSSANKFLKDGNSSPIVTLTIPNGCQYIRLLGIGSYMDNIVLVHSDTPPETYIPYLQPTDPPAPLPAIQTYQGENTLSSTETLGEVTIKGKIKEAVPNG